MNKITYIPDNQFLLDLFNKSEYDNNNEAKWCSALSINEVKNKYDLDNAFLMHFISRRSITVYRYNIFLDNDKTLLERIAGRNSKGYNRYFQYLQKLDNDVFKFTRNEHSYIISFDIIEYYDASKNILLYSFLDNHETDKIFMTKAELDYTPITVEEAIKNIKNEIPNNSANYHQVIPNSHMFSKLEQIIMAIDRNENIPFIKTGIENSIKNGYEINENHGK